MSGLPRGSAGKKGSKVSKKKVVKRRKVVDDENRRDITDMIHNHNEESDSDTSPSTDVSNTTNNDYYFGAPNQGSSYFTAGQNSNQYSLPYYSSESSPFTGWPNSNNPLYAPSYSGVKNQGNSSAG